MEQLSSHTNTTPPTLEKKIQRWVELDNEIKIANEDIKDTRTERAIINDEIIEIMLERNLMKATVNINDGKLRFITTKQTAPLTLTYIEKCLKELITNESQVEQIMKYIKNKRETKSVTEIKRIYNDKSGHHTKSGGLSTVPEDSDSS